MSDQHNNDLDWLYRGGDNQPAGDPPAAPTTPRNRPQGPVPSSYGRTNRSQAPASASRAGTPAAITPRAPRATPAPSGTSGPPPPPPTTPSGGTPGSTPSGSRRGRRRRPLWGRTVVALLAAYLLFLVITPVFFLTRSGSLDALSGERLADTPGRVVLLVGTDSRTSSNQGARTDSIMLLFQPTSGKPALISIPRDSYVPIPGYGKNKINAAYAFGGPSLLVKTIEHNTGLRVDDYLEIGMTGFPALVDAVGGINVCFDKPMVDRDSKSNFPAGCQHLDGTQTLAYARMRKADPTGDLGRMKRQREVLGKVVGKATSPATALPWQYWKLMAAGTNLVHRDRATSAFELAQIGWAMRQVSGGGGLTLMVPISNPDAKTRAGSSMIWDATRSKKLFDTLKQGSTAGLEAYQR